MILAFFPSARAEVVTGITTASAGVMGHISWINDIYPLISEVAVIAGAIVALHGLYAVVKDEIAKWKNRRKH